MRLNDILNVSPEDFEDLFEGGPPKWLTKLCDGPTPNDELGTTQLALCKCHALRAREGKKSHKIGGKRITVGGRKIKGKACGGPLPDDYTKSRSKSSSSKSSSSKSSSNRRKSSSRRKKS